MPLEEPAALEEESLGDGPELPELTAGSEALAEDAADVAGPDVEEIPPVTGLLSVADAAEDDDGVLLSVAGLLSLADGAADDDGVLLSVAGLLSLADGAADDDGVLLSVAGLLSLADGAADDDNVLLWLADGDAAGTLEDLSLVVEEMSGTLATLLAELIVTVTDQLRVIVDKTVEMLGELDDPAPATELPVG
ncbi:hypothetical protein LTR08_005528 [Meristemomyces frigidus]|nr:hypothetical protein LTR08_005528 [Meristemomyces frigidus]